jgi:hypothetical protein
MDDTGIPDEMYPSAAQQAALKWLARGRQGRKRCVMSPMDEMPWFLEPSTHGKVFNVGDPVFSIVKPNSARVALILYPNISGGVILYGPDKGLLTDGSGFVLNTTSGANVSSAVIITQESHGNLCQVEWYARGDNVSTAVAYWTEIILRDFPHTR